MYLKHALVPSEFQSKPYNHGPNGKNSSPTFKTRSTEFQIGLNPTQRHDSLPRNDEVYTFLSTNQQDRSSENSYTRQVATIIP